MARKTNIVTLAELTAAAQAVATEFETNPAAWNARNYALDAEGNRTDIGPKMVSGCILGKMYQKLGFEGIGYEIDSRAQVEGNGSVRYFLSEKISPEDRRLTNPDEFSDIATFSNVAGPAPTAAFLRRVFPTTVA